MLLCWDCFSILHYYLKLHDVRVLVSSLKSSCFNTLAHKTCDMYIQNPWPNICWSLQSLVLIAECAHVGHTMLPVITILMKKKERKSM